IVEIAVVEGYADGRLSGCHSTSTNNVIDRQDSTVLPQQRHLPIELLDSHSQVVAGVIAHAVIEQYGDARSDEPTQSHVPQTDSAVKGCFFDQMLCQRTCAWLAMPQLSLQRGNLG